MATIELKKGESITIVLQDTDGEFKITYGSSLLTVKVDLPDDKGRKGIIYQERFAWQSDNEG